MAFSLRTVVDVLKSNNLLHELIAGDLWTTDCDNLGPQADLSFEDISYDTRKVSESTLLFCKGNFKPTYLDGLDALSCYVAQTDMSEHTKALGIVVSDVHKAMALLSAEFYGHPEKQLTMIGITGTKGKTTTAYYVHHLLAQLTGHKTALLSSVDNCVDGKTYVESQLTTPESLDLFHLLREAVDNGMTHMVMEVSSQSYKVNRVFGLTFDVGAFLNISPDHISPIEHPTFEDYFSCKRQLISRSRRVVLGADTKHANLLLSDARAVGTPVTTFALRSSQIFTADTPANVKNAADFVAIPEDERHEKFAILHEGELLASVSLAMEGDFNDENVAAAYAIVEAAGFSLSEPATRAVLPSVNTVAVSGRMEHFEDHAGTPGSAGMVAIVDFAHNYLSTKVLVDFVYTRYGEKNPRITLISGSSGNKAFDRREGIVKAAQDRIAEFIFTADDTDSEPVENVCRDMLSHVTNPAVKAQIILDREQAIRQAVADARENSDRFNVILVIGKGNEQWLKVHNKHVAYAGDDRVIRELFAA